ncbi:D-glucuronyl C5-epimerase family protein [Thermococcus sp.]|uniref:D-glucuronyl C5-epimerase family protein n=1 Tax=Thermococcus sp. TaxID=35749 RepID=UPI0025CFFD76|nr:D-glucuronyl C5-epimerase family protein [Thermococcus sp.]
MKAKGAVMLLLFLTAVSSGCISVSNTAKPGQLKVYAIIEEKSAIFDVSLFNISVNGMPINSTDTPVMIFNGKPGQVVLHVTGKVLNWNLGEYHFSRDIIVSAPIQGNYLVALEIIHKQGSFSITKDESESGYIGRKLLQRLKESNEKAVTMWVKENLPAEDRTFKWELSKNRELRYRYMELWKGTENTEYLQAYRDLNYHIKTLAFLAKTGKLKYQGFKALLLSMKATDYYYSKWNHPGKKDLILVFSNKSPYYGALRVENGPLRSLLPFVYYRARGFNFYPVSALHWAQIYYEEGEYTTMLTILNELKPFIEMENCNGTSYAVFHVYFQFQNSSVPWVSGYAQGMATGMYALAYNLTEDRSYLTLARAFLHSFDVHSGPDVFVASTKYGPWYLEYAYYPQELVLNGHIIALQGLYYFWEVTGDKHAYQLFQLGAESVKEALPYFDTGNWSRYASIYNSSSEFYHRLHIKLLVWLYTKTEDETFLEYAKKWNGYLKERGMKPEDIAKLLEEMGKSP